MLAYVYRITDKVTGKYYVGSNYKAGCSPDWLGVSYFTSSKIVRPIFQKHRNRFDIEILFTGEVGEVLNYETEMLQRLDARNDPVSYNCHNNENNLNSKKIGELTRDLKIGIHGRTPEQMSKDGAKAGKISCDLRHAAKDSDGKSVFAKSIGLASHTKRASDGKSVRMIDVGYRASSLMHSIKTPDGKSASVMRKYKCAECDYEHIAMMVGKHHKRYGHSGKSNI